MSGSKWYSGTAWDDTLICFQNTSCHYIAFSFGRAKDAAKYFLLNGKNRGVITIITPFIPDELTEVGDITIFPSDGEVSISSLELKPIPCSQVVD